MIATKSISEINEYVGTSVNPMANPEQMYELYSVPSFENGSPEIVSGADIGSAKVTIEEGDVLICKINPRINRVWVVQHNTPYPLLASSEWIVIRNRTMNSSFLKWYFSSPRFRMLLTSQVTGMGGSLTRAQPKQVAKYPVPMFSREQQDYIARKLDKLDILITKRSAQLAALEELVKSRFMELFGDINVNDKGWESHPLGELCTIVRGGSPRPIEQYSGGNVPWIKIGDATDGENIYLHSTKEHIIQEGVKKSRLVKSGSLIFANCGVSLGFARIITFDGCIHDGWLAMEDIDSHLDKIFLLQTLNQMTEHFRKIAPAGTQPNLNTAIMKDYMQIVPPMKLQKEFISFVEKVDKSKHLQYIALCTYQEAIKIYEQERMSCQILSS